MIRKNRKNEIQRNDPSLITASVAHLAFRMNNLNHNFKLNPWWKLKIQTQKTAMMISRNQDKLFKKIPQFKNIAHRSQKSLNPRFQRSGNILKMISTTTMRWSRQRRNKIKRYANSKWKLKNYLIVLVKMKNCKNLRQRQVKDQRVHDFTNS